MLVCFCQINCKYLITISAFSNFPGELSRSQAHVNQQKHKPEISYTNVKSIPLSPKLSYSLSEIPMTMLKKMNRSQKCRKANSTKEIYFVMTEILDKYFYCHSTIINENTLLPN